MSKLFISRFIIPQVFFSQTTTQIIPTICERKTINTVTHFLNLFVFRGHSTRETASSRVTDFILRAYTAQEPVLATANTGKTRERVWKKKAGD